MNLAFLGFGVALIIWLLLTLVGFLFFWTWPKTGTGWVISLLFGPPILLIFELAGETLIDQCETWTTALIAKRRLKIRSPYRKLSLFHSLLILSEVILFLLIVILLIAGIIKLSGQSLIPALIFFRNHFY